MLYGLARNLEPEAIAGAVVNTKGKKFFLVVWKGTTKGDMVAVEEFTAKFPEVAISFYESRKAWADMAPPLPSTSSSATVQAGKK